MVATPTSRVAALSRGGDALAPHVEESRGTRTGDAIAVALIAIAFGLALGGPATLVLVAPIVFGVPHVASDVRYLIVRGPLRAGGALLLGIINPLAALVPLIETGPGKDSDCAQLTAAVVRASDQAGKTSKVRLAQEKSPSRTR